jgi:hypothetical protein
MLLTRRSFTSAACMAGAAGFATGARASNAPLAFKIMLDGSEVGLHKVTFAGNRAENFTATISLDLAISRLLITLYRYSHRATEVWSGGRLATFDSKTNDDGTKDFCTIRRAGEEFAVEGSNGPRYLAPANALSSTHWNIDELKGPLINSQTGRMFHPKVSDKGSESVILASGAKIMAEHYGWPGEDALDLWYTADGTWTGLNAVTKSGSKLTYLRL